VGRAGLDGAAWPGCGPTALTLGDGGIARPNLGVRAPPRPPPRAGRSKGAGEDIIGTEVGGVAREGGVETADDELWVNLAEGNKDLRVLSRGSDHTCECEASLPCGAWLVSVIVGTIECWLLSNGCGIARLLEPKGRTCVVGNVYMFVNALV
jgi:hypothetical protein